MAVVVRVKRRRTDYQPQSLELTCKKRRLDEEIRKDDDSLKNILKFAGTISTKDHQPLQIVKQAIGREKLKKEYLKYESEPVIKSRTAHKQMALEARYKIISHKRAANFESLEIDNIPESKSDTKFQLIDLETENEDIAVATPDNDSITCNGIALSKTKASKAFSTDEDAFVYDLFYTNNKCLEYSSLDDILKIEAYREEDLYMGYGEDDDEEMMMNNDDDDENEESNWRNDYPDEDPKFYDSLDENQDYEDDDGIAYGFDEEGCAAMPANNDVMEYIS